MSMNNQNDQTNMLIEKIRNGDNKAWEELISQYEGYIHSRAWEKIKGLNVSNPRIFGNPLISIRTYNHRFKYEGIVIEYRIRQTDLPA